MFGVNSYHVDNLHWISMLIDLDQKCVVRGKF